MRRLAIALAVLVAAPALAAGQTNGRLLVMPFENLKHEARIFWLGEAAAVLLADDLNALGAHAITLQERRQAFERLQVPPAASLTSATVIRIGQIVGAAEAIVGTLQVENDVLIVRARSIALETGRVKADVTEQGRLPELFAIVGRIARRLGPPPTSASAPAPAPALAPALAQASAVGAADLDRGEPPVAAFEDYIKGLLADSPDTAINYLNAALKVAPAFDRARLALWEVYVDQGDHRRALAAVQAVSATSASSRPARFLAGLSQINLKKYDEAFALFKALAAEREAPTVLNNLGVIQLQRGSTPQTGLPTYYFNRAAEMDQDDPDYFFNLGYAYWEAHDPQAAIYWLREAVRRSPTDGDAHYVLGVALLASGSTGEASREKELARRLSSTYEQWEKRAVADPVPKGLERVKSEVELPHASRIEAILTTAGQRDQQELAGFYLDRGRRLFQQENDRDAVSELNHALYFSPYLADAHLLLGRIHLRNGRAHEAIDAFKIAVWSAESAEAHAALGEAYRQAGDLAAARAEADRALVLDPSSGAVRRLLDMLKSP